MSPNGTKKLGKFRKFHDYTNQVLRHKPSRKPGEDIRDLPTYTLPLAAKFLAIPRRTLHYWFSGNHPVLKPSWHVGDIALLSFNDLSEAYVLEVLRTVYGFPLARIGEIVKNARKETQVRRPLIDADLRVVFRSLVLEKPARGKLPRRSIDLANHRNLVISELVDIVGFRVLKDRIYPWRFLSPDDYSTPITLDPEIVSGRAVVTGTRVPVDALEGLKNAGRSSEDIAKLYELDEDIVRKALLHIERPIHKKAA